MGTVFSILRTLVTLLATWQTIVWIWSPPRYILPAPLDVLAAMRRQPVYLLENTLVTLAEILAGFALGIAALPRLGRLI